MNRNSKPSKCHLGIPVTTVGSNSPWLWPWSCQCVSQKQNPRSQVQKILSGSSLWEQLWEQMAKTCHFIAKSESPYLHHRLPYS